jgi:hypothetical protein
MIPVLKTPDDIEDALESLPYVAKSERKQLVQACKHALRDLEQLHKVEPKTAFRLETRIMEQLH